MIKKVALVVMALGAATGLLAWHVQGRAADALDDARRFQAEETGSDSSPPSADDNLAVIDALARAIEVRRSIEGILVRIENDVRFLERRQEQADEITTRTDEELSRIGASLAASTSASEDSVARLKHLEGALRRSATLARLIAEELEELDRKMGPSAGDGR